MRRSLKHGPIAWRTALRWRSRRSLAFAAIAPTVFLPPLAKFAKGYAWLLLPGRGLVGGDFPKADGGAHHEISLLLGQHFWPLRDPAARQPNRPSESGPGFKQRDRFRFVHKAYV